MPELGDFRIPYGSPQRHRARGEEIRVDYPLEEILCELCVSAVNTISEQTRKSLN
jgi:hypothetical protein